MLRLVATQSRWAGRMRIHAQTVSHKINIKIKIVRLDDEQEINVSAVAGQIGLKEIVSNQYTVNGKLFWNNGRHFYFFDSMTPCNVGDDRLL